MYKKSIFWHRRDIRIEDNAGLFKALNQNTEGYWDNKFIRDKEALKSYFTQKTKFLDIEIVQRFVKVLKNNIWNKSFEIGISSNQIIFPLVIDAQWEEKIIIND